MSRPGWVTAARLAAAAVPAAATAYGAFEAVRIRRAPRLPEAALGFDAVVQPAGGATDRPGAEPVSVVAIGDSVVSGVGCTAAERSVPGVLAGLLAEGLDHPVRMRCLGRTGARAAEVRAEQVPRLAGLGPIDVIVASIGANDAAHLTPPARFAATLWSLCEQAHAATGAPVLLTGVPEFRSTRAIGWPLRHTVWLAGRPVHERQRRIAAQLPGVSFIDVLAEVGGDFLRDPGLVAEDGYHPSDRGAARLAEAIAPAVRSLVAGAGERAEPHPA